MAPPARRFGEGLDAAAMARAALAEKVVLAPGNAFSVTQTSPRYLRFNVAQMVDARVYDVLSHALLLKAPRPSAIRLSLRNGRRRRQIQECDSAFGVM